VAERFDHASRGGAAGLVAQAPGQGRPIVAVPQA
jgi:hypothetical protein